MNIHHGADNINLKTENEFFDQLIQLPTNTIN